MKHALSKTDVNVALEPNGRKAGDENKLVYSKEDVECITRLIKRHTGITLTYARQQLVYKQLSSRIKTLGFTTLKNYTEYLENNFNTELAELTGAITTNLTAFFREPHHFEFLSDIFLPAIYKQKSSTRTIRIWSAGCSTGEEAYSIAIAMKENVPSGVDWDISVLATDLDMGAVKKSRSGIYPGGCVTNIKPDSLRQWFSHSNELRESQIVVKEEIKSLVTFRQLNLLDGWPMTEPFDLIFCRNVIIYFDKKIQRLLLDRFAEHLTINGYLIVSDSESLSKLTDRFKSIGGAIYQRCR